MINSPYSIDMRQHEPPPGAWASAGAPRDYYNSPMTAAMPNAIGYDTTPTSAGWNGYGPADRDERVFMNTGNIAPTQPIAGYGAYPSVRPSANNFRPKEESRPDQRKRQAHSEVGTFYPPKAPRQHEPRASFNNGGNQQRFVGDGATILADESKKCVAEMSQELALLDATPATDIQYLTHTRRLLNEEVNKITSNTNPDWLDVEARTFQIKILKRVLLPPPRPGFNVVGRIMGVGGQTLRRMCLVYRCHVSICGAGSRKNPTEEAEMLKSGDPRFGHLSCPLHAEISTIGQPHDAYTRLGQILTLLNRIITSDDDFEHDGIMYEVSSKLRPSRPFNDNQRGGGGGGHRGNHLPHGVDHRTDEHESSYHDSVDTNKQHNQNESAAPQKTSIDDNTQHNKDVTDVDKTQADDQSFRTPSPIKSQQQQKQPVAPTPTSVKTAATASTSIKTPRNAQTAIRGGGAQTATRSGAQTATRGGGAQTAHRGGYQTANQGGGAQTAIRGGRGTARGTARGGGFVPRGGGSGGFLPRGLPANS